MSSLPKLSPFVKRRRVVVTGLGVVSPLGCGAEIAWKALLNGQHGLRCLVREELGKGWEIGSRIPIGGMVPRGIGIGKFNEEDWPALPAFIQYALAASAEAVRHSGWEGGLDRCGVAVGCGIGSLGEATKAHDALCTQGYRKVSPHFIPRLLINMAAGHVSMAHGMRGATMSPATACASGAHAIAEAAMLVREGAADAMLAGGTEASVDRLSMAGFGRMRALYFGDEGERAKARGGDIAGEASRPFDSGRKGFILSEGAAMMMIEELDTALQRGAVPLAELRSYGLCNDAYHPTAPPPDGSGTTRAMMAALKLGGLSPDHIDYVNAHATSTPIGDAAESKAINTVFGGRSSLLVSSIKGATGHLLGAAGALDAVFTTLSIRDSIAPHTLNLNSPEPEVGFTFIRNSPYRTPIQAALSNSNGFGGTNTSLLLIDPSSC